MYDTSPATAVHERRRRAWTLEVPQDDKSGEPQLQSHYHLQQLGGIEPVLSTGLNRARRTLPTLESNHLTVYKAWLCSQYFEVTQSYCNNTIPCKQYCLEVQTRCPFILPDNDDVVYGGLSSFICTGLYDNYPTNAEPECCDVRWGLLSDYQSKGTIKTSDSMMCHRTSLTVSSASRLCNSRLKLCVLVLILLHTVLTVSAAQNSTDLGFGGITTLEDNSTNEE
ncbi:NALCN channel auxiliary factor 1 [Sphaerodactylus townsendi]|uniref:NALCN channel auxiliary factor 1 n=1 Tax=Sphaerodactylus townsendi TaxID=933632 RepID=UPI0020276A93|nr:NALCN channel auxiliary factor 1 [Sphaerodactylus townsendi]